MVKFFGGNGQVFISKKQKDLAVKSIPFVLKSYGKMSLLDNQYELPWLESLMSSDIERHSQSFNVRFLYISSEI